MKKLINLGYSLVDYDGALKDFKRFDKGKQKWGNFCTIEG